MSEGAEAIADGGAARRDRLLAAHYEEFRRIARRVMRADDGGRLTLQPTDLAHEAALRIMKLDRIAWQDRTHFLAISARVMRQALIDEIRRRRALKRQSTPVMTMWCEAGREEPFDLEAFDHLLEQLFAIDADRARVVELRFYAGLTLEEVARALSVSESTVQRRWRAARAWLLDALGTG